MKKARFFENIGGQTNKLIIQKKEDTMQRELMGLYFTEEDLEFISYIHAVKIATYEQIQRDAYPRLALGTVGNRLRKFQNNGIVEIVHGRLLLRGKRLVSLSNKAFKVFIQSGEEVRVELKSDSPKHDLVLCDIRSRMLQRPSVLVYKTENELQTWSNAMSYLNSDALVGCQFGDDHFQIPLEYERVMKMSKRYEPFIAKYYHDQSVPCVLVITERKEHAVKLMKIEGTMYSEVEPKLFFATIQDVLLGDKISFVSRKQHRLVI